jgi:hypothetical protein
MMAGRLVVMSNSEVKKYRVSISNHNLSHTKTYKCWWTMKARCKKGKYKEKGITYDPRWEKFENFYADMGDRPKGLVIDRIDGTKGYYKENCRWITQHQNNFNRLKCPIAKNPYKGVREHKNKWVSEIGFNSKKIYLGLFDTPEEAAELYNKKASELFGEYACLNIIKKPKPAIELTAIEIIEKKIKRIEELKPHKERISSIPIGTRELEIIYKALLNAPKIEEIPQETVEELREQARDIRDSLCRKYKACTGCPALGRKDIKCFGAEKWTPEQIAAILRLG